MNPTNTPSLDEAPASNTALEVQGLIQPRWIRCECGMPYSHFKVELPDGRRTAGVFFLKGLLTLSAECALNALEENGHIDAKQRAALWTAAQSLGLPNDRESFTDTHIPYPGPMLGLVAMMLGRGGSIVVIAY